MKNSPREGKSSLGLQIVAGAACAVSFVAGNVILYTMDLMSDKKSDSAKEPEVVQPQENLNTLQISQNKE